MRKLLYALVIVLIASTAWAGPQINSGGSGGGGGEMIYPGAGIPVSTGSAWTTSIKTGTMTNTYLCQFTTDGGLECTVDPATYQPAGNYLDEETWVDEDDKIKASKLPDLSAVYQPAGDYPERVGTPDTGDGACFDSSGNLVSCGAPTTINATTGNIIMYSCAGDPLVCTIENAGGAINLVATGYVDMGVQVVTSTDATITVSGMSKVYFNGDDDVIAFNLPADPVNKVFCFGNNDYARAITVNPDDADYITMNGTKAAAGEAIVSTGDKKDWVCVIGVSASDWRVTGSIGTWAEETP